MLEVFPSPPPLLPPAPPSVVISPAANFDINQTIFQTIEGTLPRAVMAGKIGVDLFWCDHVRQLRHYFGAIEHIFLSGMRLHAV